MSRIRADKFVNNAATGAPQLTYGAEVVAGAGLTGAGGINITGIATAASFSGNVTGNISGGTVAGSTGTFTGDVDIADKIIHTGDTDTAIRFPAANTFAIETGGNEKIRVEASETIIRVNSASHNTFRFTTAGSNEAKLIMRDASDNDDIILSTGGVSVFNGGNFGIGQASPTKKLEVATGAVSFSPDTAGKHTHEFTTNAANDGRYKILADTTTKVDIQANGDTFFDGGDVSIGSQSPSNGAQLTVAGKGIAITGQNTDHGANSMRLGEEGSGLAQIRCYGPDASTNGSLTLRSSRSGGTNSLDVSLLSNGNLSISDGNLVVASGHGIDFSATADGSGMTSELLDDYEEGNGSPTVSFLTSGSLTLGATPTFKYVKIGDLVTFSFEFQIASVTNPSGPVKINTPFSSGGGVYSAGAVRLFNVTFSGSPYLEIGPSTSYVLVRTSNSGSATGEVNGTGFYFGCVSYRTSS